MTTTTTTTTITATPRRALSGMALLAMLLLSTSTTSNGFQMQPFAIKKAAMTSSSVTMQTPVSFTALHQKPANAATMPLFSSAAAAASGGSNEDLSSMEEKKKEVEKPVANAKSTPTTPTVGKKKKTYQELRAEGGFGTFNTPIGALNPFAIYYGLTSIFLGIPWFISCKMCQLLYWITGNRFDPKVRLSWYNRV